MKKETFKYALLEAVLVVTGVVLAFALNEYREYRNRQALSDLALQSIYSELATNRQYLQEALDYHNYLIDTLKTYAGSAGTPNGRLFHNGFIARQTFVTNAWETAQTTNALLEIDYKEMLQLAEIYKSLQEYNNKKEFTAGLLYEKMFKEGAQSILQNYGNLLQMVRTLWWVEQELLAKFDELPLRQNNSLSRGWPDDRGPQGNEPGGDSF